ncbi:GAF domain-containing sensor histidine kinase [Desulfurivibrio alkaliphilus]|uniref:histidine kinase n=1 Tax=Desulfurivibrio alkaliphilus (strain DSM 19089 / UNIQEM U267 / AHT2) TaxID=589865 RepID=D6Z3W5_DESAT|nr:ATP-binding protein [Desulfurivibrio alkaliphilus]ADH86240.1 GAF sensor signal transduction histidine kinase [Desulfurivibrio alkaliphilus AHT 2]
MAKHSRKTGNEELQQANLLLESFAHIAEVINAPRLSLKRRSQEILQIILDYLGVEHGSIMMREGRKYLTVLAASRPELVGCRQPLDSNSVAAWVAQHHEPLFIPDIDNDPRFAKRPAGGGQYRKNSLLSAPIIHQQKVIGIINATDKRGDKDLLKQDISRLLDFSSVILSLLVQQDLQQQVRKQRNTLRERNRELQRQQQLRAELSRLLVHDLKGPLSEVVANLDILSYSVEGEMGEFLHAAQVACNKAVRMVSNLTTIDKIEDGGFKLIHETVTADSLIKESLSDIKGMATIRGITLNPVLPPEPAPVLNLDRVMILRVLQNLLVNALGYSPAETQISFGYQLAPEQHMVEFFVQDQGPGIANDKLPTIFEKYQRLADKQDALVGTGLGLYFARLAVELHGGTIGVESTPGQGSRFHFSLPVTKWRSDNPTEEFL